MRLSGVWNEPSAPSAERPVPQLDRVRAQPGRVPPRPDLDQLVGDWLAVRVDDPTGETARFLELDRDHTFLGVLAGPLDQQDVLGPDRIGRDPRGHQLVSGRHVLIVAVPSGPVRVARESAREAGTSALTLPKTCSKPGADTRPGNRLAVGSFDLHGSRPRLFQDQADAAVCTMHEP